jgi:aminopeptidase N
VGCFPETFVRSTKSSSADPATTDYVTAATAHELAHQWWAHQITGAEVQGSMLLSETLANYSALMMLRKLRFEAVILYDLKITAPTAVRRADGKWDVTVPVEARKYAVDSLSAEKETRLAERMRWASSPRSRAATPSTRST